jgi:antitoxin component of MazEF toxin-antitoxin module
MGEVITLRKSGKSLMITIPMEICEQLNLTEGSQVELEPFTCGGDMGLRIKPKKDV